jgi:hypothetical protein
MAERLKSISRQIHWSLLLKAAVFAAAWLVFPFWLFLLVALYLYFIPIPQSRTVAGPFLVLLLLAFLEPTSPLVALILGAAFFYILLIKDLILIDRKSAYEVTILFLIFLLFLGFYERAGGGLDALSLFYSFCAALIAGYLLRSFIRFSMPTSISAMGTSTGTFPAIVRPATWLGTLLMWQFLIAGLFLPVDFVYQTVIAFLGAIFVIDLIPQYLFGELSREKVLATVSVIFVLFVLVLGSARWGL